MYCSVTVQQMAVWPTLYMETLVSVQFDITSRDFGDSKCLSLYLLISFFYLRLLYIQFSVQSYTRQTPESSLLQPPVVQTGEIRTALSLHHHLQKCTCKLTVWQQIFTLYRIQIQNDLPQVSVYRLVFQQTMMSLSVHDNSNGNNIILLTQSEEF